MVIKQIAIQGYDNNFSYFIFAPGGTEIAVVDPGNVPHLEFEIESEILKPRMILLTHSHHDHTEGVAALVEKYGIPVFMHRAAQGRVDIAENQSVFVDDGEVINLGNKDDGGILEIEVLHTPGHIDDAVCYYVADAGDGAGALITGDTVFVEACGRTDLEGSNVDDLYASLQRIARLPDETKIFPGHDYGSKPVSTIGWEKKHNKYFKCKSLEEFRRLRMGD